MTKVPCDRRERINKVLKVEHLCPWLKFLSPLILGLFSMTLKDSSSNIFGLLEVYVTRTHHLCSLSYSQKQTSLSFSESSRAWVTAPFTHPHFGYFNTSQGGLIYNLTSQVFYLLNSKDFFLPLPYLSHQLLRSYLNFITLNNKTNKNLLFNNPTLIGGGVKSYQNSLMFCTSIWYMINFLALIIWKNR